jgi:hypothetical protein
MLEQSNVKLIIVAWWGYKRFAVVLNFNLNGIPGIEWRTCSLDDTSDLCICFDYLFLFYFFKIFNDVNSQSIAPVRIRRYFPVKSFPAKR